MAFKRAAHQVLDRPPVFVDPLARAVLSDEGRSMLDADPSRNNQGLIRSRLRAFLAVRSRVAEDCVVSAVAAGVRQYLVLGAGLDTFACRNPYSGLKVFEVDHPETQKWKRSRLRAAGFAAPDRTEFVPVNFNTQVLSEVLATYGFDQSQPTAISWLGVVPYLETHAVWSTLEWAVKAVGDTGHIVFDYGSRPKWWQVDRWYAQRRLAARVASAGEPFRTSLDPARVAERLRTMGFTSVVDLDSSELNKMYFANRSDGFRVGGGGHITIASRRAFDVPS